jgi:hypothetical protein
MLQVILDPLVVDPNDVPQGLRAILFHSGSSHLGWLFHARTNLTRFGATNPASNVRKISYVILKNRIAETIEVRRHNV